MSRARASGVGEGTAGPQDDSSMQREDEDSHLLLQVTHPPRLPTFICLIIRRAPIAWPFSYPNIFLSRCVSIFCRFPPFIILRALFPCSPLWTEQKPAQAIYKTPVETSEHVCRCRLPLVRVIWLSSFFVLLFCKSNNSVLSAPRSSSASALLNPRSVVSSSQAFK